MGRLDKALERIKRRDSADGGPTSTPISAQSAKKLNVATAVRSGFPDSIKKITLDKNALLNNRIITDAIDPSVRTSYKMLRTRILQNMRANGWQSIAVTSATQGDGKTVTAINLAISLAGDVNHNVCLVDLDLRHSSVAGYLDVEIQHGISDCLLRGLPVEDALLRTDLDRLVLLPNKRVETHSSEVLSSPLMRQVAAMLVSDPKCIVVYDMPPVLAADDMLAFAPLVDAVLFVASEGKTLRTDAMKASELLENVNVMGTILNRSDEKTASYY